MSDTKINPTRLAELETALQDISEIGWEMRNNPASTTCSMGVAIEKIIKKVLE